MGLAKTSLKVSNSKRGNYLYEKAGFYSNLTLVLLFDKLQIHRYV